VYFQLPDIFVISFFLLDVFFPRKLALALFTIGITLLVGICPCQTGTLSAGYIATPVGRRKWLFVYYLSVIL